MPAAMHSFYLHEMYEQNNLVKPCEISFDGVRDRPRPNPKVADLHPWRRGKTTSLPGNRPIARHRSTVGPTRFVLAASGHIAGVVNPPRNKKYQHWLNETAKNPATLDEWRAGAQEFPGSWWHDWDKWLSAQSGPKVPARVPGQGGLPAIEDAPGTDPQRSTFASAREASRQFAPDAQPVGVEDPTLVRAVGAGRALSAGRRPR